MTRLAIAPMVGFAAVEVAGVTWFISAVAGALSLLTWGGVLLFVVAILRGDRDLALQTYRKFLVEMYGSVGVEAKQVTSP